MAASGGGWMVDFTLSHIQIPLGGELPNEGRFTVYGEGVFVGSAEEWDRMAGLLMETSKGRCWSDEDALRELGKQNEDLFLKELLPQNPL